MILCPSIIRLWLDRTARSIGLRPTLIFWLSLIVFDFCILPILLLLPLLLSATSLITLCSIGVIDVMLLLCGNGIAYLLPLLRQRRRRRQQRWRCTNGISMWEKSSWGPLFKARGHSCMDDLSNKQRPERAEVRSTRGINSRLKFLSLFVAVRLPLTLTLFANDDNNNIVTTSIAVTKRAQKDKPVLRCCGWACCWCRRTLVSW